LPMRGCTIQLDGQCVVNDGVLVPGVFESPAA
jgi:hypothetical protein